jgi:hypothetical protein
VSFAPSPAPPPSRPGPLSRLIRDKRVLAAAAAVVVLAGTVTVVSLTRADDPAPVPSDVAQAQAIASSSTPGRPSAAASVSGSPSVRPSATVKPPAAAKPAAPGWIPVDQAAWNAQVAAYRARKTDPVPAGVSTVPEFRADCQYSHRLADDPIVFPGLAGASHMHSFVGNKATDADTTAADLTEFTATTCKPVQDHSAYWVPTLYDNATGQPVETTGFRVYYRSIRSNSTGMMPMPNGLRLVAGDAKKKVPTPRGAQGQFYCAFYGPGDLDGIARSTNGNWPICGAPATLHFMLQFPDCWDGKHLDSPNHKDHLAYGTDQGCPAGHPVRIPALTFDIQYGAKGTKAGYYLSSDPVGKSASSMHGDAFEMWNADAMNKRTKDCLLQRRQCDNDGYEG